VGRQALYMVGFVRFMLWGCVGLDCFKFEPDRLRYVGREMFLVSGAD